MELNGGILNMNPAIIRSVEAMFPDLYQRKTLWSVAGSTVAADRRTVTISNGFTAKVGSLVLYFPPRSLDLDGAANWDSLTTDYTVPANRAGKDFSIYALATGQVILSANSTVPTGYTAANSRQVGGFHCLCVAVGVISGHPLTGFLAGDVVPASIWDVNHRPTCSPRGMVYSSAADIWVDIYLQSSTEAATGSVFGATITDTRSWWDHAGDLAAVGKRMLGEEEFTVVSLGAPQGTNILNSNDPVITGGHVDTNSRRIISNVGCEDIVGVLWHWINGDTGSNSYGLLAGGYWNYGSACGSRCRKASDARASAGSADGSRGCARRQA